MTSEAHRPKTLEAALVRIAEECSEVTKVVCKALRFGLYDHHPIKKKTNYALILEELSDIADAEADFHRLVDEAAKASGDPEAAPKNWQDVEDQWAGAIAMAHPMLTGDHQTRATAAEMVGNRHSKGALIDLVNWLLTRKTKVLIKRLAWHRTDDAPKYGQAILMCYENVETKDRHIEAGTFRGTWWETTDKEDKVISRVVAWAVAPEFDGLFSAKKVGV